MYNKKKTEKFYIILLLKK